MNKGKEIEDKSMLIIDEFLDDTSFSLEELPIVRRILHTTGDPDYRKIISIQHNFVATAKTLFQNQPKIYCDTRMIEAGVNKRTLAKLGGSIQCLVDDEAVFAKAKETGDTRSALAVDVAIDKGFRIFVFGNAPTALFRLLQRVDEKKASPLLVIGVPVGYVGAADSKEALRHYAIPQLSTVGTKGGSNVAASVVNAILYEITERC